MPLIFILFVCSGNSGRSPMAEGIAKTIFHVSSFSRGIQSDPVNPLPEPNAVLATQEIGVDISKHRAQNVTAEDINKASLVLAMTRAHKQKLLALNPNAASKIFMLSECADGTRVDIEDAYEKPLEFQQKNRDIMLQKLTIISKHGWRCHTP